MRLIFEAIRDIVVKMMIWNQFREKMFPPPNAKWLVWIMVPSSLLLLSANLLLFETAAIQAGLLSFALLIQIVFALTGRKTVFTLATTALIGATVYFLGISGKSLWLGTLFIPLYLSYQITSQVLNLFVDLEGKQKELERDSNLWKTRFETLREKIDGDKEVWEREIDQLSETLAEKQLEMERLRVLIHLSHKETRQNSIQDRRILDELNELRCKHHETELLLEKANQELDAQQGALRGRQTINELLQSKTTVKKPISLKDLAKNI